MRRGGWSGRATLPPRETPTSPSRRAGARAISAARQRHFKDGHFPASTYVVISALAAPQFLVEIEAVAMID